MRYLGAGLLTVSVSSLAVIVAPVAVAIDVPLIDVVDAPSLRAVTRGIVIGLVLTGNAELAERVVGAGKALQAGVERRSD